MIGTVLFISLLIMCWLAVYCVMVCGITGFAMILYPGERRNPSAWVYLVKSFGGVIGGGWCIVEILRWFAA